MSEHERLLHELLRKVKKTSLAYDLLEEGDRILVAVSGGKDSYTLLHLLARLQEKLPFSVDLIAVHLDQKQPGYDGRPLEEHLQKTGVPFEILAEDTYSVVIDHVEEGDTYCSLCSRLRRGILYTAAERLGCNKIALGHHREDALETFLMNLFYSGKLQAMPAAYTTDDGRFRVIRPMIECAEADIARFAELERFPILPCNLCGSQPDMKRDQMSRLMATIEETSPHVRAVMLNALKNVRPTHLLDPDLIAAWSARPPEIRPAAEPKESKKHFSAASVVASGGKSRLRVVSD